MLLSTVGSVIFCEILTVNPLKKSFPKIIKVFDRSFDLLLPGVDLATNFTYLGFISQKLRTNAKP